MMSSTPTTKKPENNSLTPTPPVKRPFAGGVFGKHGTVMALSPPADKNTSVIINEVQLVLAEKRTSLSVMRTGIAVLALPLSVLSVLVATSKYYEVEQVLSLLVPLGLLMAGLLVLGVYLVGRSALRMRHYDHMIQQIKRKHSVIAEFIE